jgi:type I restriction enzyme R subunit
MKLSKSLTEEETRYIHEGFDNDEQLSMFDVLMKDDLSKEDIKKLKKVAKDLLEKIKQLLATMDHPFDKQETKAAIIITIRDILWKELPESYPDESINYYRDAVYNYVSQHYGSVA